MNHAFFSRHFADEAWDIWASTLERPASYRCYVAALYGDCSITDLAEQFGSDSEIDIWLHEWLDFFAICALEFLYSSTRFEEIVWSFDTEEIKFWFKLIFNFSGPIMPKDLYQNTWIYLPIDSNNRRSTVRFKERLHSKSVITQLPPSQAKLHDQCSH